MNVYEYEIIEFDFKEDYSLGNDLECHQGDDIILNFEVRNYGELVDLTNYNVRMKVRKGDGSSYTQSKFDIEKNYNGEIGHLRITCERALTSASGLAKGTINIWNSTLNQKNGRVINIRVIKDPLEEPNRRVGESTITVLNHLDDALNELEDVVDKVDELKKEVIEIGDRAEQVKKEIEDISTDLDDKITEANQAKENLNEENDKAKDNIIKIEELLENGAGNGATSDLFLVYSLNTINLAIEEEKRKNDNLINVNANLFVETFQDTDKITFEGFTYDSTNKIIKIDDNNYITAFGFSFL